MRTHVLASLLTLALLTLVACKGQPEAEEARSSEAAAPLAPQPRGPFSDVPLLCGALQPVGIPTRTWKYIENLGYQCISNYIQFGPEGPLRSNIAYYVSGKQADQVDDITILVNVNVPSTKAEARERLLEATKVWFQTVNIVMPAGLEAAIHKDAAFETSVDGFAVTYNAEQVGRVFEMKLKVKQ